MNIYENLTFKDIINPKIKPLIIILSLIIIGIIIGQIISNIALIYLNETAENLNINISNVVKNNIIKGYKWLITLILIDIVLLISLLWIYVNTYRKTKSSFIIGLNFFIGIYYLNRVYPSSIFFHFLMNQ